MAQGIKTVPTGADFSRSAIAIDPAVPDGCLLAAVLASPQRLQENLILGGAPSKVVGSPSQPNELVRFIDSQDYVQTRIAATDQGTLVCTPRYPSFSGSSNAFAVSAFGPAPGPGIGFGASPFFVVGRAGAPSLTQPPGTYDPTSCECFIAGWDANSQFILHPRTGSISSPTGLAAVSTPDAQYRIGGSYTGGSRQTEPGLVMIYDRKITDAGERAAIYDQVKRIMALLDIVV